LSVEGFVCYDTQKLNFLFVRRQLLRAICWVPLYLASNIVSVPAPIYATDTCIDISVNLDILSDMDLLEIFKALSNPTRLQILKGLKDPAKNFPPQDEGDVLTVGVCVSSIQEGIGLSQSTVSGYLATLQRVGLVEVRRIGQWTYYKRNEATISALAEIVGKEL
jgi:ArsR family transcriptional regulator